MQGSERTAGTSGTSERLARRDLVLLRLEQRRREAQRRRAGRRTVDRLQLPVEFATLSTR